MIVFKAEMERFAEKGEKSGWTYVFVPQVIANEIKPDCRKSFRVKGRLDGVEIVGMSLIPMGEGNFIMALNAELRKKLKKQLGAVLDIQLEEDTGFTIGIPDDLQMCLEDEPHLLKNFLKQPKSHQNWYINWLNTAKTEATRTKRIVKIINAMDKDWDFGTMMREGKARSEQ